MYSTGHGSIAASPDGSELYYVHHGRPSPTEPQRRLYTERMQISATGQLTIDAATSDRPIPSGVAPYSLTASRRWVKLHAGDGKHLTWEVRSADGVPLALDNPLNRVAAQIADPAVATIESKDAGGATIVGHARGQTTLTLTYQRELASGRYADVSNGDRLVSVSIPIRVSG
jgi:hypothetical protein